MFVLQWKPKAVRQFEKINNHDMQAKIAAGIDTLEHFPKCKNIKMLKTYKTDYRLRVGRYRILFNVNSTIRIIKIEEIKKRDDQTY
jgi:mRNA interferase RelE/StbE